MSVSGSVNAGKMGPGTVDISVNADAAAKCEGTLNTVRISTSTGKIFTGKHFLERIKLAKIQFNHDYNVLNMATHSFGLCKILS